MIILVRGSAGLSLSLFLFLFPALKLTCNDPTCCYDIAVNFADSMWKNATSLIVCADSVIFTSQTKYIAICLLLFMCGDIHPNPGPSTTRGDGISIVHVNARSLQYKTLFLEAELGKFDIITVSETWLSDKVDQDSICLNGYHPPVRRDRPGDSHGGVAVYVKCNLICKPRIDLCIPDLEAIWIETKLDQDTLLVGVFYRPPSATVDHWLLINDSVQLAMNTPHKFILFGDLNADCTVNPPFHLQELMNTNSLSQLTSEPTRITDTSSTLIDLVLTPCPNLVKRVGVLPPVCSDHSCPFVYLNHDLPSSGSFKRTLYNYSKIDVDKLLQDMESVDWNAIVDLESIDDAAEMFSDKLMMIAKECMPVKIVTMKGHDAVWITEKIKKMIKKKQYIHALAKRLDTVWCWSLFRRLRNNLTDVIRKRKEEHIRELENRILSPHNFGNKDWWKIVNSFLKKKGMSTNEIPPIESNGIVYYSAEDKAEVFNETFLQQSRIQGHDDDVPPVEEERFSIGPLEITTEMVYAVLNNLDVRKAVGPDLVHNKLLKLAARIISNPLATLFQRSLTEGRFPKIWKVAHVNPIYKKGEKEHCSNYRPVSLLSCIGKVLEKCVQAHVFRYITDHDLLTVSQSGFIPGDSTSFQLLSMYDDFCQSLDKQLTSQAVFCDISKAFDRVWHKGLLHKLYAIGIRGALLKWFEDYLTGRLQAVVIQGRKSTYGRVCSGVPQGSVLGPLLFLVYINDIVTDIKSVIKLFADDTSLYLSLNDVNARTQILNADLTKIALWAEKWKVNFNNLKTDLMTLSRHRTPETLPLAFDGTILRKKHVNKHLGVLIPSNCN